MAMVYKGRELELPLSDENREFLVARSKDTLINQLDREWASIKANQDARAEAEAANEVEEEDEDPGYEQWTVDELKAEIDARNAEENRPEDRKLTKTGKQAELAARIREDDEAGD